MDTALRVIGTASWDSEHESAPLGDKKYYDAVLSYVREHKVNHCGSCHQSQPNGALMFSDGLVWCEKMSNWAVTMSEVWGDGNDWGSREFGCSLCWESN